VSEERKVREGRWVRWRGRWDPMGARGAASVCDRHAVSGTHRQSVMEVRTVRPLWTETSLLFSNSKLDLPSLQNSTKICVDRRDHG
jgi:hypothetical protein